MRFLRLLKIALSYKSWMALAALLGFLTIGSAIGLMVTSAYIIAKAALQPSISELGVSIVGVRFFGIARGVFRYLERYVSHEVTFRLLAKFRVWLYCALEPLAPARLLRFKSSDLLTRIVADVESLEHIYVRVIAPPVVAVAISILMWFLFGIFSVTFSIILMMFFFLAGIGVPLLIHRLSKNSGRELIALRSQLNTMAIDGTQGMPELIAFGQAQSHLQEFETTNQKYISLQRRMARINGLHEALIGFLMNMAVLTILIVAIPQVSSGVLDGVFLSVLTIGTMAAFEAVWPLPAAAQHLGDSLKAGERLFEITDAKPVVSDSKSETTALNDFSLKFDNVSFSYNRNERPALKNLSFEIPEKSKIAIVGPSGAGKSTIVNLLMRFWDINSGRILLGGKDTRKIPQERMREYFAVVSQATHLFNGSILENLLLANPQATEDDISQAAKQAQIHDFIQTLPAGYDTQIGEQGLLLSSGQRQRLAICRAILKNTPIIIFDEATANLDAVTEQKILQTIWQLAQYKTTLLITHRLTGLEKVDEILVLREGQIIENGHHQKLIAKKGTYFKLWQQQNQFLPQL